MKFTPRFTKKERDIFSDILFEKRTSKISNPDGSLVFEASDVESVSWALPTDPTNVSCEFGKSF